jgi:phosphoglycerol transferase MdoB-like AlkP superfamily enzyme
MKKPFISFTFTSTTHTPFVSPGKKWEVYPHNDKNIFGYLNTLKYADDKLGKFMQKCKKQPWFDNTIFLFMADHALGLSANAQTDIKSKQRSLENMRIPLLIYAPKIFEAKHIDTIGSQVDILPTLIDILGFKENFSSLSNSLFSPNKNQFAIFLRGQTIGIVNKSGYVLHTLEKKLESTTDLKTEKELLSAYQTTTKLLRVNKWYK